MSPTRRVIRSAEPARPDSIDDQLWPVNLALFVLAAFCTGLLAAVGDFQTANLLKNGWTYIALIWLVAISVMLFVWKLGGRQSRRLQLSGVLAMIIVLWLGVASSVVQLFVEPPIAAGPREPTPQRVLPTAPDYFVADQNQSDARPPTRLQPL